MGEFEDDDDNSVVGVTDVDVDMPGAMTMVVVLFTLPVGANLFGMVILVA